MGESLKSPGSILQLHVKRFTCKTAAEGGRTVVIIR